MERDLARLADGTLSAERARELEPRVAESPELRALLDEQRRALGAIRSLPDRAPASLRERVESRRRRPVTAPRVRRVGIAGALVAVATGIAVALVAVLPSGSGGPTLAEAAAFTLRPATAPAPAHTVDGALDLKVDGVPYPYWTDSFGWKAAGTRIDAVRGRTATTVFYTKDGRRIGYTIVTGAPVSVSGNPSVTTLNGIRFRSLAMRGATVVTWERKHHSCILSGRGVSRAQLLRLASWRDRGALAYTGS